MLNGSGPIGGQQGGEGRGVELLRHVPTYELFLRKLVVRVTRFDSIACPSAPVQATARPAAAAAAAPPRPTWRPCRIGSHLHSFLLYSCHESSSLPLRRRRCCRWRRRRRLRHVRRGVHGAAVRQEVPGGGRQRYGAVLLLDGGGGAGRRLGREGERQGTVGGGRVLGDRCDTGWRRRRGEEAWKSMCIGAWSVVAAGWKAAGNCKLERHMAPAP